MPVIRQRRRVVRIPGFEFVDRWCESMSPECCEPLASGSGEPEGNPIFCEGFGRLPRALNVTLSGRTGVCGECGLIPYQEDTGIVLFPGASLTPAPQAFQSLPDTRIHATLNFWPNGSVRLRWYANSDDGTLSYYRLSDTIPVPNGKAITNYPPSGLGEVVSPAGSSGYPVGGEPFQGLNQGVTTSDGFTTQLLAAPAPCEPALTGGSCDGWLIPGDSGSPSGGLFNTNLADKYNGLYARATAFAPAWPWVVYPEFPLIGGGIPTPFLIKRPASIKYIAYRQLVATVGCTGGWLRFLSYVFAFVSYVAEPGNPPAYGPNYDLVPSGANRHVWSAVPLRALSDYALRSFNGALCEDPHSPPFPSPPDGRVFFGLTWVNGKPRGQTTSGFPLFPTTTIDITA